MGYTLSLLRNKNMFNTLKKIAIINRANDEILYEYVLDEIEEGVRIKGLWAKALAHSDGIDAKAKSIYMQYRVQNIKDQFDALKIAYDEMSRKRLFDYIKNGFKETVSTPNKRLQSETIEAKIVNSDFNNEGINKYTGTRYDKDGFTKNGFDVNGFHKYTKTKYDEEGFDKSGYNKDYQTRDEIK